MNAGLKQKKDDENCIGTTMENGMMENGMMENGIMENAIS
jgi:hypothetical protein